MNSTSRSVFVCGNPSDVHFVFKQKTQNDSLRGIGATVIEVLPCVSDVGSSMYTLYSFKTAEASCVSQDTGDMLLPPGVPDVDIYVQQVKSWNSRDALNSDRAFKVP